MSFYIDDEAESKPYHAAQLYSNDTLKRKQGCMDPLSGPELASFAELVCELWTENVWLLLELDIVAQFSYVDRWKIYEKMSKKVGKLPTRS
jgi:hypothetical protein